MIILLPHLFFPSSPFKQLTIVVYRNMAKEIRIREGQL